MVCPCILLRINMSMPTSITAALQQLKAASKAAGASVMGPAMRESIRQRICEGADSDDLWENSYTQWLLLALLLQPG